MKKTLLLASVSLAALGLVFVAPRSPGQPSEPAAEVPALNPKLLSFVKPLDVASGDSELTKKLKERHNSAAALLDERVKEYQKGTRDINSVYEAARLTMEAKMDLASGSAAKTEVLEKGLEVAKLVEAHLQQQLAHGFGSKADLERARYGRLSLEVDLLRAKQK